MPEASYDPFLANLEGILTRNGYPAKRVALPLEKMYEVAHGKGLNFNKALVMLEERGVAHEKTDEKIVFFPKEDLASMMRRAEEMLKTLSPEQLADIQKMYEGMTDEQRAEMMEKARAMGLST